MTPTIPVASSCSSTVLGSRSPRRRELLGSVVAPSLLRIVPPSSPDEPGFGGLTDVLAIEQQLKHVVRLKHEDVQRQVDAVRSDAKEDAAEYIVVADTIVIATNDKQERLVLGQPGPTHWADDVRRWFQGWLSARTHEVWTGLRISRTGVSEPTRTTELIVKSLVTFCDVDDRLIDWYISTGESVGKAGGYAIQGHVAAFVLRLEGSLTNVIGLPVIETREALRSLGWTASP